VKFVLTLRPASAKFLGAQLPARPYRPEPGPNGARTPPIAAIHSSALPTA
jgi:hypothetical protein